MTALDYLKLAQGLLPELSVTLVALFVLTLDLTLARLWADSTRKTLACWILSILLVLAWVFLVPLTPTTSWQMQGWYLGGSAAILKKLLVILGVGTCWMSREHDFTCHVGEYMALVLLATVGAMVLVSADHLVLAFVGLELLSLCLYLLTAFSKAQPTSAEAGLKYFLFGGVSAAVLLYGLSLLYGATGEVILSRMAGRLAQVTPEPLLYFGILFVIAGLSFKIAAAPFHLWVPDVYEGAPTSSAAFIASASKIASFSLLARIALVGWNAPVTAGSGAMGGFVPGWIPILCVISVASLLIGNFAALAQTRMKRLIAYSAVAHAGYIVIGLLGNTAASQPAVLYYAVTYAVGSFGILSTIAVLENLHGSDSISSVSGLIHRSPFLTLCLAVFLLSLAGIPPLAGFFAKFYVFSAALSHPSSSLGLFWLVLLALATSCLALYYYLQILKRAFTESDVESASLALDSVRVHWITRLWIGGCALATIIWGCFPELLLAFLR